MQILVTHDSEPVRTYHDPREIIVHPESKQVMLYTKDGKLLETLKLVDRKIEFVDNKEFDTTEIIITIRVE